MTRDEHRLGSPAGEPFHPRGEKTAGVAGDGEAEGGELHAGDLEPGWLKRLLDEDDASDLCVGAGDCRAPSSSSSSQLSIYDEGAA